MSPRVVVHTLIVAFRVTAVSSLGVSARTCGRSYIRAASQLHSAPISYIHKDNTHVFGPKTGAPNAPLLKLLVANLNHEVVEVAWGNFLVHFATDFCGDGIEG